MIFCTSTSSLVCKVYIVKYTNLFKMFGYCTRCELNFTQNRQMTKLFLIQSNLNKANCLLFFPLEKCFLFCRTK